MSKLTEVISNIPDENLRKYLTDFANALKDEIGTTVGWNSRGLRGQLKQDSIG